MFKSTNKKSAWRGAFAAVLGTVSTLASANTFVYVSNAEDGDISSYQLSDTGRLIPGPRTPAAKLVMPMAASTDGRYLYAASRTKPFSVLSYSVNPSSGALRWLGTSPLPESMVHIGIDQSGRWLMAASYGGNLLSISEIGADGRAAAEPAQVMPSGGIKPHSLKTDRENQYLYVPHLGTDEVRTYKFDAKVGKLEPLAEASATVATGSGPRHFVVSKDNRFVYVLAELKGTVTVFERDSTNGKLNEIQTVSSLPADTRLIPGQPRVPVGTHGAIPFDESTAIWCADIQITPDGRFLYTSERTKGTLSRFAVDRNTGHVRLLGLTETEAQPRGFAIDAQGRYLVASGEKSSTVSLYEIDGTSGNLTRKDQVSVGKGANWVQIVQIK